MLQRKNPTELSVWKKLNVHHQAISKESIREQFSSSRRVTEFSAKVAGIYLDYSKNLISPETLELLTELAKESGLEEGIQAMRNASKINEREDRAVLHYALRSNEDEILFEDENIMNAIRFELDKIKNITDKIHSGEWKGYTGKRIKYVVNIGIGGSDLGPNMVCNALRPYWTDITPYFLSNVDAAQWEEIRHEIVTDETIFIIASKTFTTDETMTNAHTVKSWFLNEFDGDESALAKHFLAVSTNLEEVNKFGIPIENIVGFWSWIGGRFSLWSAVGISIGCTLGYKKFEELLIGGREMDEHFFNTDISNNLPVLLALLTIWQVNFCGHKAHAILPYDHRLRDFPRFLQQMIMESNGKQIDRDGRRVNYSTCPVYFGEPGTNGQHAFYQLLHQGSEIIPSDFIAIKKSHHQHKEHHNKLLANCFAQSEALMDGNTNMDLFRNFEGNRPSNTILLDELNPKNLGALISLYEHMVFVQGIIWNIYSFDQWGVELGKILAKNIVAGKESSNPSTISLLTHVNSE